MPPKDSDYEVGYRKPPRKTQFQKGRSGNPKGRPRHSRNARQLIEAELNAPVWINENGVRKRVSKLEAFFRQLVNRALAGNERSGKLLLEEIRELTKREDLFRDPHGNPQIPIQIVHELIARADQRELIAAGSAEEKISH